MKKILRIVFILIVIPYSCGCKSIHVSGSGEVGGVHGSGGVSIPLPKQ